MNHVLIATPSYDRKVFSIYMQSIIEYITNTDLNISYLIPEPDSLVTRSRNEIFTRFYENIESSDFTHLLWQDSDIYMNAYGLQKMISYNLDVIGQACPLKCPTTDYGISCAVAYVYDQIDYYLYKTEYVGTGILLLSKQAVYDIVDFCEKTNAWYWDMSSNKKIYDVFKVGIDKHKIYQSEDWYLCSLLRSIGKEVYVDSSGETIHAGYGRRSMPINPESIMGSYQATLSESDRHLYWTPNDWLGRITYSDDSIDNHGN